MSPLLCGTKQKQKVMKKSELVKFVETVEQQFNQNKHIIIEGYEEYLKNGDTYEHKTMCIESWGVAMIGTNNEHLSHLPFKELYNFINSFRGFAQTRPHYAFEQKPDCYIEYYTDNFLIQSENLGVKKLLNTLQD
jgi:hypothetical protein